MIAMCVSRGESKITSNMSDDDIDRAIRLHEGDSLPGFPSPVILRHPMREKRVKHWCNCHGLNGKYGKWLKMEVLICFNICFNICFDLFNDL